MYKSRRKHNEFPYFCDPALAVLQILAWFLILKKNFFKDLFIYLRERTSRRDRRRRRENPKPTPRWVRSLPLPWDHNPSWNQVRCLTNRATPGTPNIKIFIQNKTFYILVVWMAITHFFQCEKPSSHILLQVIVDLCKSCGK